MNYPFCTFFDEIGSSFNYPIRKYLGETGSEVSAILPMVCVCVHCARAHDVFAPLQCLFLPHLVQICTQLSHLHKSKTRMQCAASLLTIDGVGVGDGFVCER